MPAVPNLITVTQKQVTQTTVPQIPLVASQVDAIMQTVVIQGVSFSVPITSANLSSMNIRSNADGTFTLYIQVKEQ